MGLQISFHVKLRKHTFFHLSLSFFGLGLLLELYLALWLEKAHKSVVDPVQIYHSLGGKLRDLLM